MIQFESGNFQKKKKDQIEVSGPKIRVVGVGGAGCGVISRIHTHAWNNINFVAIDSSSQTLKICGEVEKFQLGTSANRGWGTGGDREMAGRFAEEAEEEIRSLLSGADLLFVVCGLGKGTGSGASPVLLKIAREMGCLSIGFFILPFYFEGKERVLAAKQSLAKLWQLVDGGVIVSNDVLLQLDRENSANPPLSIEEAFTKIDEVFENLLKAVEHILYKRGIIDLDFADFRSFLEKRGRLMVFTGKFQRENFDEESLDDILRSSIWGKVSIQKARNLLLHVSCGVDFGLAHLEQIVLTLEKKFTPSLPLKFGVYPDKSLAGQMVITLLSTVAEIAELEVEDSEKPVQKELESYDEHDLDVPTFLRKQHG